jgi:hypothetical protein
VAFLACCLGCFLCGNCKIEFNQWGLCGVFWEILSFPSSQSCQIYFCLKIYHFRNTKYWHDGRRKLSLSCRQSVTVRELLRAAGFLALRRKDSEYPPPHTQKRTDIRTSSTSRLQLECICLLYNHHHVCVKLLFFCGATAGLRPRPSHFWGFRWHTRWDSSEARRTGHYLHNTRQTR